jgi:glutaredoxin 3
MKPVKIFTTPYCPYCVKAKRLLTRKNVPYEEIDVAGDDAAREKLTQQTGMQTVPQIFIGDTFVGGSDDLHELESAGKLDGMLA